MFCPECGNDVESTAKFCRHCRHRLTPVNPTPSKPEVTRLPGGADAGFLLPPQPEPTGPRPGGQTVYPGMISEGRVLSGRYKLVSVLGQGGMGQVWKAKDRTLGRDVAVKMLPPEIGLNPRAKEAMKNEAQLLLRLSHPNICRLYTYEEDGRACFLVMELVEGKSLEQELEAYPDRRMPLEKALPLFSQVAEALDYAHGQNPAVLHRDIKPANIMVDGEGRVKVLDFGIACEIRETMTRMTGKASAGTLLYMSPEQVKGDKLASATDIYSVAVSMYEALGGTPPFTSGAIEFQIVSKVPGSLIERGAKISKATEESVLRGLAKEVSSRPGTCGEFVRQVREADKTPVKLEPSSAAAKVELPSVAVKVEPPKTPIKPTPNVAISAPVAPSRAAPAKTREIDLGGGVKLELVLIPAGTFMMGSPVTEKDRSANETQHEVTISKPFYLGKYPVTQAQWQAVMGNNPSHFKGERLPVESVSWEDAVSFCGKAKQKTGQAFRLPTEAQWEYACRAGTTTPFHFGSKLNGTQANCDGNYPYGTTTKGPYLEKTSPVGSYPANGWGLYDMHGNVWEWCSDWYGDYGNSRVTDPQGAKSGDTRVLRGGSWISSAVYCRAACRYGRLPGNRNDLYGIRVLLPLDF